MANINLHNVSKEEEALMLAKKDMIAFGKLFLPDDFMRSETRVTFNDDFTGYILNEEQNKKNKGKTTIDNKVMGPAIKPDYTTKASK